MLNKAILAKKALSVNLGLIDPYKLTFAVTYRCNSRCANCSIWKKKSKNFELSLDEIRQFFAKNRFRWLNLTGGEVFLRQDLVDIIKSAGSLEILSITTNGIMTDNIIETVNQILALNKVNKFTMVVSIDGSEHLHDRIRGVQCWKNAIETLQRLRQLSKNNEHLKVFAGYTVAPQNLGKLEETSEAIKKEIPDFQMAEMHVNVYHVSDIYFGNAPVNMNKQRIIEEINKIIEAKSGNDVISFLERKFLKHMAEFLETGRSPLPCKAVKASIFIDTIGNVYPCTMMNETLGNLRDNDFDLNKILDNPETKRILDMIKNSQCPGCWTACEAYQTILSNMV
ncbi:MAG: radical SAM protein [Candidatus Aenigmatarchaeota archaeon]